jgi:hypothetical protein
MEEIENYERIGGLKNEISKMVMQKFAIDQMCVQRNRAINSLILLQSFGVTDQEILNIHEFLNEVHKENAVRISHTPVDSLTSDSYELNLTNNR